MFVGGADSAVPNWYNFHTLSVTTPARPAGKCLRQPYFERRLAHRAKNAARSKRGLVADELDGVKVPVIKPKSVQVLLYW